MKEFVSKTTISHSDQLHHHSNSGAFFPILPLRSQSGVLSHTCRTGKEMKDDILNLLQTTRVLCIGKFSNSVNDLLKLEIHLSLKVLTDCRNIKLNFPNTNLNIVNLFPQVIQIIFENCEALPLQWAAL